MTDEVFEQKLPKPEALNAMTDQSLHAAFAGEETDGPRPSQAVDGSGELQAVGYVRRRHAVVRADEIRWLGIELYM